MKLKLRIGVKLAIGFGAVALILCIVGMGSYFALRGVDKRAQTMAETFPHMNAATKMQSSVLGLMWLGNKIRVVEHTTEAADIWKTYSGYFQTYEEFSSALINGGQTSLGTIKAASNPELRERIQKIHSLYTTTFSPRLNEIYQHTMQSLALGQEIRKLSGSVRQARQDEKDALDAKLWELDFETEESGMAISTQLAEVQELIQKDIDIAVAATNHEATTAERTSLLGVVIGFILATLLGILITRSIVRPLSVIISHAQAVSKGDLDHKVHEDFSGQIGVLKNAIASMVGELKHKLGLSQGVIESIASSFPCLMLDTQGRITYVNDALPKAFGKNVPAAQLMGMNAEDVCKDKSTLACPATALRDMKHVDDEVTLEVNGTTQVMRINSDPIFDLDGQPLGSFILFIDLTEIREQERKGRQHTEKMSSIAARAGEIATQVTSAADELSNQVDQASSGSEVQNERTAMAVTSISQLNSSVLDVARNAGSAAENASQAKNKATTGQGMVSQVVQAIEEINNQALQMQNLMNTLGSQAEDIGRIITVIEDIADQTNLLALNAAIEAARAGDAGRGFAVVADEVRKLAEKTMDATKDVSASIRDIQSGATASIKATQASTQSVSECTELAENAGSALNEIVSVVDQTADQVQAIATASEEQSTASEEISRTVEDIAQISSETASGMRQATDAIAGLAQQASQLQQLIEEMRS